MSYPIFNYYSADYPNLDLYVHSPYGLLLGHQLALNLSDILESKPSCID